MFGRFGRADAEGAFATCHCLTLPESEPGYYFWRDRATGELTRRSEWFVTKSPQVRVGADADQVPDLVRAAALLRSVARALPQGRALSGRRRRGSPSSTRSSTSSITSIRTQSGIRAFDVRRRHRLAALARPAVLRGRRRDGEGVSGVTSRSGALRFPASTTSTQLTDALRRRGRDHVPEFSVVSAALHGARASMPATRAARADGAAEAADTAGALHRRRPAHPPVHREQHAAADPQGPAPRGVTPLPWGRDLRRLSSTHC